MIDENLVYDCLGNSIDVGDMILFSARGVPRAVGVVKYVKANLDGYPEIHCIHHTTRYNYRTHATIEYFGNIKKLNTRNVVRLEPEMIEVLNLDLNCRSGKSEANLMDDRRKLIALMLERDKIINDAKKRQII